MSEKLTTTYLSSPLTLKSVQNEGQFCGYASVFNTVDTQGDRILKGAFEKSLQKNKQEKTTPKMLWQHDVKEPIGLWHVVKEDHNGLYVEGQLLLDLQKGREAYSLLKKGVLDGLSIGCSIKKADFSPQDGVRELHEVDLLEVSLVTFAANQEAKVTSVKRRGKLKSFQEASLDSTSKGLIQEIHRAISVLEAR